MGYEKEYLIRQRLSSFMQNHYLENYSELADYLEKQNLEVWKNEVISAITINETSFFRDHHPFENFGKLLQQEFQTGRINILSIGCSAGQEPVSIAIVASELGDYYFERIEIDALDIDPQILQNAASGKYSIEEINRGVPKNVRQKYFSENDKHYQIIPRIQNKINYKKENIIEGIHSYRNKYDIVFLRNVLIYFKQDSKEKVIRYIYEKMKDKSYLILGSSENIFGFSSEFSSEIWEKSIFYRRTT